MKFFPASKKHQGYLLIELMVSLTIFSIVTTTSIGAVLAIVEANAKSQTTKAIMDNMSVALENISRSVRLGTNYSCISDHSVSTPCTTAGAAGISFTAQDGTIVEYFFKTQVLYRFRFSTDVNPVQLTDLGIVIDTAKFYINGAGSNDGQPRLFVVINGHSGLDNTLSQTSFVLQSTVTQRVQDPNQ